MESGCAENYSTEGRDWCSLMPEMLCLISKKLPDISDFIIFRAVCKTWRSSSPISEPPPQLPWIILHPKHFDDRPPNLCLTYLSSSGKLGNIYFPKFTPCFWAPHLHHIVAVHPPKMYWKNEYSLLNPITNNELYLSLARRDDDLWLEDIVPDPTGGEYLILSEVNERYLRLLNPFDMWDRWPRTVSFRRLEHPNKILFKLQNVNRQCFLYYNGQYYYLESTTKITRVVDVAKQKLAFEVPPIDSPNVGWSQLVESNGAILMLRRKVLQEKFKIDIYQLNLESGEGHACWIKTDSIGDQVLFLDSYGGFSLSAENYPMAERNCIYILNFRFLHIYNTKDTDNMEMCGPYDSENEITWFFPTPANNKL